MLSRQLFLSAYLQYEHWHFPRLSAFPQSNTTASLQLVFYPNFGIFENEEQNPSSFLDQRKLRQTCATNVRRSLGRRLALAGEGSERLDPPGVSGGLLCLL